MSYEYRRRPARRRSASVRRGPRSSGCAATSAAEAIVTPAETESRSRVKLGPAMPPPEPAREATILADRQPPPAPRPSAAAERDAADAAGSGPVRGCNVTSEEFVATRFTFDYADHPEPLSHWWGNPTLTMPPSPRVVQTAQGRAVPDRRPAAARAGPAAQEPLGLVQLAALSAAGRRGHSRSACVAGGYGSSCSATCIR